MKKLLYFILILSLPVFLFAQEDFHLMEAKGKIALYKKLMDNPPKMTLDQENYDVTYYRLELDINPVSTVLTGKVTIQANVINNSINLIDLNLTSGFTIDSVTSDNKRTTYSYSNNMLNINLSRNYNIGEKVNLTVYYHGIPQTSGFGSWGIQTRQSNTDYLIWTLSEPFGARDWWPCKDFPEDKADSADIIVTVPNNLIEVSNGVLRNTTAQNGKVTFYWHESYPIVTYLISVTAYAYTIYDKTYQYTTDSSMINRNYVFPDHLGNARTICDMTPNMIKVFSDLFGQYPFIKEKYSQVEFPWSGGMEHQTCTSLGGWSEYLSVHELSHQWWGDMVTCKDFHHIWMNEGFANYCEALYAEVVYGKSSYFSIINGYKYTGSGTVYVPDLSDVNRIFNSGLTYNKGAFVLHMLRHVVGDSTFFKIFRTYYNDNRYRYNVVTTENFRDLCESVYGQDLHWFFQQWIYQEYYPSYQCYTQTTAKGNQTSVKLRIDQNQSNYIFKMPIDINISTSSGDTLFVVYDSLKTQEFNFIVNGTTSSIKIDKDNWILRDVAYLTDTENSKTPNDYNLYQNYPNPFNNETQITFSLAIAGNVSIKLFDPLGREVKTLVMGNYSPGVYRISLKANDIPSGTYFYQLISGDFKDTRNLILLK